MSDRDRRQDDEIASRYRERKSAFQPFRIVPDDRLRVLIYPESGEASRDERRVGVDDVAEKKLGADAEYFRGIKSHFSDHCFLRQGRTVSHV